MRRNLYKLLIYKDLHVGVKQIKIPRRRYDTPSRRVPLHGFTLVELLVVISIIALLVSILLPALSKARLQAQAVVCSSNMRQYGFACVLYAADNDEFFPPYCNVSEYYVPAQRITGTMWIQTLAPYVGGLKVTRGPPTPERKEESEKSYQSISELLRCPTGKAWMGVHYGTGAPFVIVDDSFRGYRYSNIKHPSSWIAMLDTYDGWGMYSPNPNGWPFDSDRDDDGIPDTSNSVLQIYNFGAPKAHGDSCSIALCDGHVEKLPFKKFLNMDNGLWKNPGY